MNITGHLVACEDKRGNRYWRIRLDYGRHPLTGKRQQPYEPGRYTNERQAQKLLDARLIDLNRQPATDPTRRTVAELLTEWLATEAKVTIKPGTLYNYESACRVHLLPAFGHLPIRKLTTVAIEEFRARKLAGGTSTHMVSLATLHLGQAIDFGIRHGYLSHNPVRALKPLRHEHKEMHVWDAEQAQRFLAAAAGNVYSPYWLLALHTGMRRGELLALEWGDIDFDRARLSVRRSLDDTDGLVPEDTKTGRSRTIDLDRATLNALREHRIRQQERRLRLGVAYRKPEVVLASTVGGYINPRNVTREMEAIIAAASVPRIRVHDLRHTAATLMLAAGVPIKVVSERLGHSSVAVTLGIYAHVLPGMQAQAAETLRRVLAGEG
jgi:integrase